MFWDNLKSACDKQGIKITPLLTELKISTGSIGKWQKGGNVSSETLLKLSDKLDVSIDYLVRGDEIKRSQSNAPEDVSYDEQQLLSWYRALPPQGKQLCSNYVKGAYDMNIALGQTQQTG